MKTYTLGYVQMLLSAASFAFSSVVAKWAYGLGLNPFSFTLGTSLVTVLLFAPFLKRQDWQRPQGTPWWALVAYPICGAGSGILFNATLAYLDISLATLLLFIYPAVVALGAWLFFGQRPSRMQLAAVLLTLLGAVLTTGPINGQVQLLGVGLAMATTLSHSAFMLLGERVSVGWAPKTSMVVTRAVTGALILAIQPGAALAVAGLHGSSWGFLLFAALVCVIAPFLFLLEGITRLGASRAAIISTAELPIALLLGWTLFHERLGLLQAVGAALILAALLLMHRPDPQPQPA